MLLLLGFALVESCRFSERRALVFLLFVDFRAGGAFVEEVVYLLVVDLIETHMDLKIRDSCRKLSENGVNCHLRETDSLMV